MMNSAVWMRARAEMRARWRAALGLTLVIGLAGGVVLAAAAGARRTHSAYPRFLVSAKAGQGSIANGIGSYFGFADVDLDRASKLPQVVDSARFSFVMSFIRTPEGKFLTPVTDLNPVVSFTSPDGRFDTAMNIPRVLAGRRPDPSRADEIGVSYLAAQTYGIRMGDVLDVRIPTWGDLSRLLSKQVPIDNNTVLHGPHLQMHVVGTLLAPSDMPPGIGYPVLYLTPAFARAYTAPASQVATFPALGVRLHGDAEWPAFQAAVQRDALAPGATSRRPEFLSILGTTHSVERTANLQSAALWLLAALMALTVLLILSQTIARQMAMEADDYGTLAALGFTRSELFSIAMARLGLVALAGGIVAVLVGFALSPLAPIGTVRVAEVSPGLSFDTLILGGGGFALIFIVVALGVVSAARTARARAIGRAEQESAQTSRLASVMARSALPASSVVGVRMGLETGRGRTAVPVRSALVGVAIGLASIVTALTFAASMHTMLATPRLQGWNWSGMIGNDFDSSDAQIVLPALHAAPDVSEISAGGVGAVSVDGVDIEALGVDQVQGQIGPKLTAGTAARRDDEVVLGTLVASQLHVHPGDTVTVSAGPRSFAARVTGIAVMPAFTDQAKTGRSAFMTFTALKRLLPGNAEDIYLYRLRAGSDARAVASSLKRELPGLGVLSAPEDHDLGSLRRIENLPLALAGLLGLVAAATLAHMLVSAIRRRRRDLGILKTLGFVRRQVRATVAWQASALVIVAMIVGIPVGIAAGRWGWSEAATHLGVLPEPAVSPLAVILIVPSTLLIANAVAAIPARAAARTRSAEVLRAE